MLGRESFERLAVRLCDTQRAFNYRLHSASFRNCQHSLHHKCANPRTALKYIYGHAFRAPNAYENYYADGIVLVAPTTPLKPEKIASHEVIIERGLSPWLQMTLNGSYNHLHDLIDQVPDPSSGLTHFVNIGRDRGRTIEMELEAKRASGVAARASYTLEDAQDSNEHSQMENSPKQMAKFNGT